MKMVHRLILAAALMAGLAPAFAQSPTPVPALPDTERRTSYNLTASTCACSVGFALYGDSTDYQNWLEVWINGVQANYNDGTVGWTITSPSGSLATLARPITDAVLTFNSAQTGTIQIVGARRPRRVSQFNENTGVSARNLNQTVTDIVAMLREVWDKINDVTGRVILAPPGETLPPLPSASIRANNSLCFDPLGNPIVCTITSSGSIAAGNGISITGTSPKTITNNIQANSPITITGTNPLTIACPTCNTSLTPNFSYLPSRANAITQNLSAFSVVQTAGYATPGDGGGAMFKNVGSAAFKDTYVTAATLIGGTGYVNGTYLGVILSGGIGGNCEGQFTVAGGVVTAVSLVVPCAGLSVGTVLTVQNSFLGGTGSGFSYTVTSISTPQASFTDSVGTHFQYVINGSPASVTQFGAIGDWNGTDASATNNSAAFWSANAFASIPVTSSTAHTFGQQIFVPHGTYMTCGAVNFSTGTINYYIPISQNVRLVGSGPDDTTLKECAADSGSRHYIELCNSNAQSGEFGCAVENMTIDLQQVTTATTAAVYSNSGQQFPLGVRLHILAANRSCILYETGKGGAANDVWYNIDCVQAGVATSNPGFSFNSSSTQHIIRDSVIENGSSSSIGIANLNGRLVVDGLDIEGYGIGLQQNTSTSGNLSVYRNVQQNSNNCSAAIQLTSGNTAGNIMFENVISSCPTTIQNLQTSGTSFTGNIVKPITCPTTCS